MVCERRVTRAEVDASLEALYSVVRSSRGAPPPARSRERETRFGCRSVG